MKRNLKSSKFWIAILDAIIASIVFFLTLFLKPEAVTQALFFIGIWQPVLLMVIKGITDEDVASKSMGVPYEP
jgi:hypothetical protein